MLQTKTDNAEHEVGSGFDPDVEQLKNQELDSLLMPPPVESASEGPTLGPRPTAASLGLKESIEECMKVAKDDGEECKHT